MKSDFTHVSIILDRSGSMSSIRKDTIGGFNTFITDQKKDPGITTVSLYQFSHNYEVIFENKDVKDVPDLTEKTFVPDGMTALYDAIGKTVVSTGKYLAAMKEEVRPARVICVIITDGEENSSREYKFDAIKAMITEQQDTYNWKFVFIGADLNSMQVASSLGVSRGNSLNFSANSKGTDAMYSSLSRGISELKNMSLDEYSSLSACIFSEDDRTLQDSAKNTK